jgi:hypothetical protein
MAIGPPLNCERRDKPLPKQRRCYLHLTTGGHYDREELKAFAANVSDDSTIEFLELGYFHSWGKVGAIRATLVSEMQTDEHIAIRATKEAAKANEVKA